MTTSIGPHDDTYRPPAQPRVDPRERMTQFFKKTIQVAGDGAAVVGNKTIRAGKTTAKFAGILAAIGGILLALLALICKICIG